LNAHEPAEREEPASVNDEFAQLYCQYGFLLRRRCRRLVGDDHAADDVLQEVFVKFLQSRSALFAAENRVAWMYRVVDRACLDFMRRRKVRRVESIESHEDAGAQHPAVDLEARNAVLRLLRELPDAEWEVAVLAYVDGMNQTDIAAALGLSRPTIWKRLTAVRERLSRLVGGAQS
jgi:RNA polymerase sigma-70 factor (ECF subfamily)